jgi:hypothetical protein
VKSRFGLASLAKKLVSFAAVRQFLGLFSETFDFLIETIGESLDVFEATTLHDTTLLAFCGSYAAGSELTNLSMPLPRVQFQSEHRIQIRPLRNSN